MLIGNQEFDFSRQVYVMGILNVTPDSFSDGGFYLDPERALDRALRLQEEGAALIDLGAESSRPGARTIAVEEECGRLLPVLRKIIPRLRIPVSVDTRKAVVAERALQEGAMLINDISALRYDFRMAEVIAEAEVPCILMHMRGEPETMQREVRYLNVVSEVIHFLRSQLDLAVKMGISRDRILVDPGLGFGKLLEHNLEILKRLAEFKVLENPVVIGASRKTFVRHILERDDPLHPFVQTGSLAVAAVAVWNGASLLRAHDVEATCQVVKIVQALRTS